MWYPAGMRDRGLYLLAALAACGGDSQETATTGAGGASTTASTTATSTGATSSVVTAAATTSGGMQFVCDPPAEPGSLYELSDNLHYGGQTVSMCELRGEVVLAVNVAAI